MDNMWSFGGEVVRLKEHTYHDMGATIIVRGVAERSNELATNITELEFIIPQELWQSVKKDGLRNYSKVELQGHFESWATATENNYRLKTKLVTDFVKILRS